MKQAVTFCSLLCRDQRKVGGFSYVVVGGVTWRDGVGWTLEKGKRTRNNRVGT